MKPIAEIARLLARLPGLGPRSARRIVHHLLQHRETVMRPLAEELLRVAQSVKVCALCGNWDESDPCGLCRDSSRDGKILCVIEQIGDLWALERSACFSGRYHVLGGVLSAMQGVGPEGLRIDALEQRVRNEGVEEVVLATNLTVEGQTTAHYIADRLSHLGVRVTRLARGVPLGGELDYMDEGTLETAMRARHPLL